MSRRTTTLSEGFDLLDKTDRVPVDPDLKELTEPLNLRTSDVLDLALGEIYHDNPGGYLTNKQYYVEVPGSSYPKDFTFDRFYWARGLLVDFVDMPHTEDQKERVEKAIAEKKAFVATLAPLNGKTIKYLPIVGSATLKEIASVAA